MLLHMELQDKSSSDPRPNRRQFDLKVQVVVSHGF